jgi:hypothetical protein
VGVSKDVNYRCLVIGRNKGRILEKGRRYKWEVWRKMNCLQDVNMKGIVVY